jgi:hypothetical protein
MASCEPAAPAASAATVHRLPRASMPSARSRRGARAAVHERRRARDQREVELVAALRVPGALREVDLPDRGDHRAGDQGGRGGREGAQGEQRATSRLRQAGRHGVAASRPKLERMHHLARAVEPRAAEPAEQLLGAVADEEPAYHGACE